MEWSIVIKKERIEEILLNEANRQMELNLPSFSFDPRRLEIEQPDSIQDVRVRLRDTL